MNNTFDLEISVQTLNVKAIGELVFKGEYDPQKEAIIRQFEGFLDYNGGYHWNDSLDRMVMNDEQASDRNDDYLDYYEMLNNDELETLFGQYWEGWMLELIMKTGVEY